MPTTCELCDRPAGTDYLCRRCAADLTERLEQLPGLYAALGDMLAPAQSADGGGRSATATEAPLPVRVDVVNARGEFVLLEGWARALAADWQVSPVRRRVRDDLGDRVRAASAALGAAVPWIAAQWPAAGDCAREVRDLYDGARSVTGAADLPARMGRCPQLVGGQPCGAELLLPAGVQVLRCAWCGATYPPGIWAALRVAQRALSPSVSGGGPAACLSRA
ncbi:hypothetical protein [Streptomyces sp. NPDC020983]|uniref:hypothetical protein n=1 Tax=Streptomyces sp. NPDC020983 TaxID=3365106 RepID=UPI0037ABF1A2